MGCVFSVPISCNGVLDCISKHPNYAFELGDNLPLLRDDWDELKRRRNDIKRRIEAEERDQQNRRLDLVDGWLSRIDAMEVEVDELVREGSREILNKCLGGCCPKNCKASYKLGWKVGKKQPKVSALLNKGSFDVVTSRISLPPVGISLPPVEILESTFDEVWSCIEDDQVGIVGIYGMGGIGKTTILNQVNNKLCDSIHGFDIVVSTVVSKTPNLTKIQDDIGEKIGFHGEEWKNQSQKKRSIEISKVLKEKKYLLLLDDIWDRFDLVNLGIPPPNHMNKSKVIFTTRLKTVCSLMKAHKEIQVKCLTDEVAWNLFQKEVGEEALEAHLEIRELAEVVAKECGGFPLALIMIGQAMASKMIPQDWHHAIELLKRYTLKFTGTEEKVFSLVKVSYDTLPNAAIRSCFLYCSLYPEDYEIPKKELIDYWICEDFFVEFNDLSKARNEGHDYISTLIRASLLEECSPEKVKMYDVIRDMAIWIACDCGAKKDKFIVQARAGLWKGAERVSQMHNKITKLTGTRNCPNLLTLFLNNNNCEGINSGFFQYMPNLRVLNLSNNRRCTSIPMEICELVSLQYLNLSGTSIQELPTEFQNLINLKYLNLSYTGIHIIREGVLSSFKKLQILKLLWLELGWGVSVLMKEMESLEYLNDLAITIESVFDLSYILSSQKLIRITTTLTLLRVDMLVLEEMRHCTRTRYIDMLVLKEMRHLESLEIFYCESLEEFSLGKGNVSFLNIINHNYFPHLRTLLIGNCHKLKDITWLAFAPNLEEIGIVRCSGMKEVVSDGDHQQIIPFEKLTSLFLDGLPELESIYPTTLLFSCLKELTVIDCPKLKMLSLNSNSCKSGENTITIWGKKKWWKGLEWEDEATRLTFLSSFKRNPW